MYGNYFPYGQFGMQNATMYGGMIPRMTRMAGNSLLGNVARTTGGNAAIKTPGMLSNLFKGVKSLNWGGFLTNTQKTLGIVNQAIPVYHQVKPLYNNARTALQVFKAVGKESKSENNNSNTTTQIEKPIKQATNSTDNNNTSNTGPNFFI
jgi:hypothetical protein